MPAQFDKLGIRFMYPENWRLDESEAMSGEETVTVYSPAGSFWMVRLLPTDVTPRTSVDQTVEAMRELYQEFDTDPFTQTIDGFEVVGCEMNFYCLDLTNTAVVKSFRTARATIVVLYQADDRELAGIEPVFKAMTKSLQDAALGLT